MFCKVALWVYYCNCMMVPLCVRYHCYWQLRFSLFSRAVTTKVLAVAVFLYYSLVSGSVEYPMPYASCLASSSVVECSSSSQLFLFIKELCLSEDLGFCNLLYLLHSHDALWDSLSRLMPSGIACLASQAPDWAVASGIACLACDWLIYDWCPPKCVYCKTSYDWLLL